MSWGGFWFKIELVESSQVSVEKLQCSSIETQMRFFQGRILTIIDASIADERHNKAVKDLVKEAFRDKINHFWRICLNKDTQVGETINKEN